jgi:flagellar biosynthesis/type III secretory pathway chaperone
MNTPLQPQPGQSAAQVTLSQLGAQLRTSLNQDTHDVDALHTCLDEERRALEGNLHDALPTIAKRKATLVDSLNQRQQQRAGLLKAAGYSDRPEQWEATLAHIDQAVQAGLAEQWSRLAVQLTTCRRQLLVNEQILAGMRRSVGRFLNILRGQTGAGQTYDAKGVARRFGDDRPITKA